MRPHVRPRPRWHRRRRDRGFVLVWMAVMLVALLAMAGLGVDVWRWWYVAQRVQRAADAGALAGAVYMPGNEEKARSTALAAVAANGYDADAVEIRAGDDLRQNQLEVGVTETVRNFFLNLVGVAETTITRRAVAEYQGPVPMGSPANQLGNDPFGDQSDVRRAPRFWVNVAAPNATTQSGDRHQAGNCSLAAQNCVGGVNQDYEPRGYSFVVDVRERGSGPLRIQAYDPGFWYVGDTCQNNLFDAGDPRLAELETVHGIPLASQRFVRGNTQWCSGDQEIQGGGLDTTYVVRAPDDTPYNDFDNPIVCTRYFQDRTGNTNTLYDLLRSTAQDQSPARNAAGSPIAGTGLRFRDHFRTWVDLCPPIPASDVVEGEYIVQIRTNAREASPTTYDASIKTGGHNRLSLRAGFGNQPAPGDIDTSGVGLFANGRLPIYVNQNDGTQTTRFYLARLEPLNANRTLELTFFDIGDVSGGHVNLRIIPPADSGLTTFSGCRFQLQGKGVENLTNCSRTGMKSGDGFQGGIVRVWIPIPDDYTCDAEDFENGCWTQVELTFSAGTQPMDTTTWSANIVGDPVRLVE